jgi:lipopolysaccharide/colanic/teichoic acid biosynthesis glycosyltransferase
MNGRTAMSEGMLSSAVRRAADVAVSLVALVVLSPLLAAAALAIVIESPGSPFYRAPRVGQGGRLFRMWKLRSMIVGASRVGPAITGGEDPRITRVGRLLRKTKIDELPQFVNVLAGDMTLVGPRPESPDIVALYTPAQRSVLEVKPGATGRVQLESGEESESIPRGVDAGRFYVENLMDRKIQSDLEYLRTRTVATDAKVILETTAYVLRACLRRPAQS